MIASGHVHTHAAPRAYFINFEMIKLKTPQTGSLGDSF
jgi:hypothetical protein